MQETVVNSHVG